MRWKPSDVGRITMRESSPATLQVRIPGLLRSYTDGAELVLVKLPEGEAGLGDALAELDARFPGMRFRIVDEQGAVRPHIKLFVDGILIRDLASRVKPNGELMIVGALSGG
jgi:molybdopterin synthase sulfur carrier subunit